MSERNQTTMTALDPVSARMFPTLAKYARRQRRLGLLGVGMILCALSFAGGVVVGSYRGKVADETYYAWGLRLNTLERDYQEHHPKMLRTTKAQAAVVTTEIERRKEP
jgi:hypothetical protein